MFSQVFSHWSRPHHYIQSIESDIANGKHFELSRKIKSQKFSENLRDFSTVCQAVVRIAPLLNTNSVAGVDVNCHLNILAENLITTLNFFTSNKLHTINVDASTFQTDYDYL